MKTAYDGVRAIAFDMDGTLLDSMPYWRKINSDFLAERGLEPPEEVRADLSLTSNRVCAQLYASKFDLGMTPEQILNDYQRFMKRYYETVIEPKPDAKAYLEFLRARGIKTCLATASSLELARPALEKHGIYGLFDFAVSSSDIGADKAKPEFYRMLADRFGVPCGHCGMFEDALYAMRGAKEAGFKVFAIEEVIQRPFREEIKQIADVYIQAFREIM